MIHIGYGDSANGCLREAMKNHGLEGEKTIPSRDDFTQGPISKGGTKAGIQERIDYWSMIDQTLGFDMDVPLFYKESMSLLDELKDEEVLVWQGDSCHDILATAFLMTYLSENNISWNIVDLAQISPEELNEGWKAVNLAMFTPEQIGDLYKYKLPINDDVIQTYKDLWVQMCRENGSYRILEEGELKSVNENYHDAFILSCTPTELEEAPKVIGSILSKSDHRLSDTTVEWRFRKLIALDQLEYEGDLSSMSMYSIRRRT